MLINFFLSFFFLQRDDIDEDMLGHVRSAAGKARLLATQKFKQFEGNEWILSSFALELNSKIIKFNSILLICNAFLQVSATII